MNKSEWIWVAIRIFGIYLMVLAIIAVPDAIGNVYGLMHMADAVQKTGDFATMASSLQKAAMAKGTTAMAQIVIFSIASFYFLRHGKAIHNLASRENA